MRSCRVFARSAPHFLIFSPLKMEGFCLIMTNIVPKKGKIVTGCDGQVTDRIVLGKESDNGGKILELETKILNGQIIDVCLENASVELLETSPLLMKAYGELLIRRGNWTGAREALEKSIKGLAGQTFEKHMLSAMALLAILHMRTGRKEEAVTILTFLLDEARYLPNQADGTLYMALAQGAHLIGQDDQTEKFYLASMERFEADGNRRGFNSAGFGMFLRTNGLMEPERWNAMLECFRIQTEADPGAPERIRLLRSLEAWRNGQWGELERLTDGLSLDPCDHDSLLPVIAQCLTVYGLILRGASPEEMTVIRAQVDQCCEYTTSSCDLEAQFFGQSVKLIWFAVQGDEPEVRTCIHVLQALLSLGMAPAYRCEMDRLSQLAAERLSAANRPPAPALQEKPPWRIEWFHGLRFTCKEREIRQIAWKRKKALELFLFLLSKPQYTSAKEWVAEALFGDDDGKKTANQLYVAIHQLKRVLKEQFGVDNGILISGGTIRLHEGFIEMVDVEKYFTLVRVGDQLWISERELSIELYEEAVQMYGPVLPEFQYLDWLDGIRARIGEHQSSMLYRLGRQYVLQGDLDRAAHYYMQRVEINPLQEEAYQELLQVLIQSGRRTEAKEWFGKLEQLCRKELDTEPLEETRKIVMG